MNRRRPDVTSLTLLLAACQAAGPAPHDTEDDGCPDCGLHGTRALSDADVLWLAERDHDFLGGHVVAARGPLEPGRVELVLGATSAGILDDEPGGRLYLISTPLEPREATVASIATVELTPPPGVVTLLTLAAGDADHDGRDELLVGSMTIDSDATRGTVSLLTSPVEADSLWRPQATFVEAGTPGFGESACLGGVGRDDIAVLASGFAFTGDTAPQLYLFDAGATATVTADDARTSILWDEPDPGVGPISCHDDMDGDGIAEILIGMAGHEGERGAVAMFDGSRLAGTSTIAEATAILPGNDGSGRFGSAFATGDLDGDGTVDLVVGAPFADGWRGEVSIVPGPIPTSPGTSAAIAVLHGTEYEAEFLGSAVAVADLADGGELDLVLGAPRGDDGGVVLLVPGPHSGRVQATSRASFQAHGDPATESAFGTRVLVQDVDDNGSADIIATDPESSRAGVNGGVVGVFLAAAL